MTTTPPDRIADQIAALDETRESRGWREHIAPALTRRIAELERAILAAGDGELDAEETRAARRERQTLLWVRDTPERLAASLSENLRQSLRSEKRTR